MPIKFWLIPYQVSKPEHQADIIKYKKLLEHGGIYLDFDVIVVKQWRPLMCYPATLGMEMEGRLCAGIILASQRSKFLQVIAFKLMIVEYPCKLCDFIIRFNAIMLYFVIHQ